tara:strand:- start:542 stop:676 length:135 start_codon:yes stop_codon:yes gene_type:complete
MQDFAVTVQEVGPLGPDFRVCLTELRLPGETRGPNSLASVQVFV